MIVLAFLVVLVLLAAMSRLREAGARGLSRARDEAPVPDAVLAALHRAVGTGLITAGQEEAILASERAAASTATGRAPARVPPVLEALGYLGSIFVIIGSVSLVSSFWNDLESWSRLTILGLTAAALTAAGLAVRDEGEPVLWRLRGFVLLLATGALAGFSGLATVDSLDLRGGSVALIVGAVAAAHAGFLWSLKDRPAQHVACLGGLIAAVAGGLAWSGGEGGVIGLVLWALGGAWLAASARRLLPPAFVGLVLGAALTLAAAGVTSSQWNDFGVLFGLATAGALVGAGIHADLFPVTGVGVLGSFFYLPATLGTFFEGTIGVPAVMLLSGLALLVLTMWLLQHRSAGHPPRPSLT